MTTGTGSAVQRRADEHLDLLTADLQRRAEPQFALKSTVSSFQAVPGLRGFWPMSSFNESGNAYDLSTQGRTLSYNGNPTYDYDNLVPCLKMDGSGDYLSRTDEAGLDILGTETYVASASRGMTIGGWFNIQATAGASEGLMAKYNSSGVNQRAYLLYKLSSDEYRFLVSDDGTATDAVTTAADYIEDEWQFVVGRFTPSNELAIFVDGTWTLNTTSIPASIFNSNADFNIGAWNNGASGQAEAWFSMCFLSVMAVADVIIEQVYEQSRVAFGRL